MRIKKYKYILMIVFWSLIITSCANRKDVVYFQGDTSLKTLYENNIPTIQPDDILTINVTASDPRASLPFNQVGDEGARTSKTIGEQNLKSYIVSREGTVDFPILGIVKIGGLTRQEATDVFKERLKEYIIDPGVTINFSNFKVSVIGEVNRPGTYILDSEHITLLEALALAGDLSIMGKRDNVIIIRESEGTKQTYTVDLTQKDALDAPVYYLKQNDVIYVEPNKSRVQSSVVNYQTYISIASISIALLSLLIRAF